TVWVVGNALANGIIELKEEQRVWGGIMGLVSLGMPIWVVGKWNGGWLGLLLTVLVILGVGLSVKLPWRIVLVGVSVGTTYGLVALSPVSKFALGRYWKGDDFPLLEEARKISSVLQNQRRNGEGLKFWYREEGSGDLRMLQSFFLHEFTKWKGEGGRNLNFPFDEEVSRKAILQSCVNWLILLSTNLEELKMGMQFLEERGVEFQKVAEGGREGIPYWVILNLEKSWKRFSEVLMRIPATKEGKWWVGGGGNSRMLDGKLWVKTSPKKLKVSANLELPIFRNPQIAEISLRVAKGLVRVEVGSENPNLETRAKIAVLRTAESVRVKLPADRENFHLLIRNYLPSGASSEVILEEVLVRGEGG
ncbi:MAG: hypothetical protein NZL93_05660, partial [Chthoniobacterales bacterium]|nr:hypothetical protein [Chthoniobacterales bacterium]